MEADKISQFRPIIADRLVIPLASVIGAFVVITPAIIWASNITSRLDSTTQQLTEIKTQVLQNQNTSIKDGTRITVVETNYAAVLTSLNEIKQSLDKIETRFNLN